MSRVTNVILLVEQMSAAQLAPWLTLVAGYYREGRQHALVAGENSRMPVGWYGGNQPATTAMAAIFTMSSTSASRCKT